MASLRHRRGIIEAEDYVDDDHDDGSRSSNGGGTAAADSAAEEEEEEDHRLHLGLHSMTAKGIQHLCSELLEIKKASEQDFRSNVYLSYLSFLRMFHEIGDLDKDVHHLKRQVTAHRRLIQHLSNNLYSSSLLLGAQSDGRSNSKEEADIDAVVPVLAAGHEDELELDVLLSEHRMDQALQLLEVQGQALQRMQQITTADQAEAIASSMCALSSRKARVADGFASVADNPRTPRAELLKALSGLCKLGDAERANHLLFKFYRSSVVRGVEEMRCSPPSHTQSSSNYIKELACMVFSSILQASRSFVALHGHPSPYTPDLIRWAREEMEDLSIAFSEFVKSVSQSEAGQSLVLALEAAKCTLSYSSLLRPLDIVSEHDLVDLIVPCLREVLTMYARHLKEVIRLFVASDAWVLGRFLISGILRSPAAAAGLLQIEHCLLTTSGRKLITLIQEVVEDVHPLLDLRMNNSVLQLLAELFREYMHSVVELIPRKEVALQNTTRDQQYMWQLSILINCTTLVSLFPIIAHGVFKSNQMSDGAALPSVADFSTQRELNSLILLIKEAAGQVWTCFCQQFIRDTMLSIQTKSTASLGEGIPSSPQGMMPSFAFQVLFLRLTQLNNLYGTILTGKDGTMKKLLQELMEGMIFWLSNNLDSWIHHAQGVPRDTLFRQLCTQIQLDVHFLLEFAQLGGFSSENIRTSALDLLRKAEEKVASSLEHDTMNSGVREKGWGWATDAAKHAVEVLMGAEAIRSSPREEANAQNGDVVDAGEFDTARNGQGGEEMDDQFDHDSIASSSEQKDMLDSRISDVEVPEDRESGACDGGKSSDEFLSIEDDDGSATEDGMSSEKLKLGMGSSQAAPGSSETDGEQKMASDHPETDEVGKDVAILDVHGKDHRGGGDENAQADHESGLGGGGSESSAGATCHDDDAIEVEAAPSGPSPCCDDDIPHPQEGVRNGHDDSSCSFTTSPECEFMLTARGSAWRRRRWSAEQEWRQASTTRPAAAAAAEKGAGSTTWSRKRREAVSRSSRPRWQ
ncbi:exocyst complex component EXO84B-like [Phragmites australis]|uniref:exocyst complex component EXO84B-like n=1 Tax=Phragmites australis TaxID=29695 RepID=UPI002D7689E4|nr:exocyst complex component EXO84B-like [Phragmites australis]